ncbi:hypothetical protein JOM56_010026 [Amanita muscaria]
MTPYLLCALAPMVRIEEEDRSFGGFGTAAWTRARNEEYRCENQGALSTPIPCKSADIPIITTARGRGDTRRKYLGRCFEAQRSAPTALVQAVCANRTFRRWSLWIEKTVEVEGGGMGGSFEHHAKRRERKVDVEAWTDNFLEGVHMNPYAKREICAHDCFPDVQGQRRVAIKQSQGLHAGYSLTKAQILGYAGEEPVHRAPNQSINSGPRQQMPSPDSQYARPENLTDSMCSITSMPTVSTSVFDHRCQLSA